MSIWAAVRAADVEEINVQLAAGATIDEADQEGENQGGGAERLGCLDYGIATSN